MRHDEIAFRGASGIIELELYFHLRRDPVQPPKRNRVFCCLGQEKFCGLRPGQRRVDPPYRWRAPRKVVPRIRSFGSSLGIEFVRPASFARAFDGLGNVPDKAFEDRVALIDIDEQDPLEFIRREKPLFDVSVTGSPINGDARSVFAWPHKFRRDRDRLGVHSYYCAYITTRYNTRDASKN
jgi:hypothetical protein